MCNGTEWKGARMGLHDITIQDIITKNAILRAKAVCLRKAGSHLDAQALIDFLFFRIARFKKPKYLTFVSLSQKNHDGTMDKEKVKAEHRAVV